MNWKAAIPGTAATAAADLVADKLPSQVPEIVRRIGTQFAAYYVADYLVDGKKPGLKQALFGAAASYLAADLAECGWMRVFGPQQGKPNTGNPAALKFTKGARWAGGGIGGVLGQKVAAKV